MLPNEAMVCLILSMLSLIAFVISLCTLLRNISLLLVLRMPSKAKMCFDFV